MKQKYTKKCNEQGTCPNCKSLDIDYGESGDEGTSRYYEFTCTKCGCRATEWYEMTFEEVIIDEQE